MEWQKKRKKRPFLGKGKVITSVAMMLYSQEKYTIAPESTQGGIKWQKEECFQKK
jgi:hypothetical protein